MKTILVYCWGSLSEQMAIRAIKDAGHQVVTVLGKMKDYHADAEFAQRFMSALHAQKADMVFSYDYFPLISMICEMNHIPYATWVYDCPQYGLLSKTITNSCNHIFCFDGAYAMRLQQMGGGNVYHFPLACDLDLYESAWVKKNEPELFSRIDKIMLPGDYIAMRLTGEVCTTVSGLSEGMFWDFQKNEPI